MARRKDDPREQAAKGYPRRRKKQTDKEIAAAEASAAEPVQTKDDPFPLPDFFARAPKHWAVAIKTWHELADVLRASGRRRPGYRVPLARYCAMTQKYIEVLDELRRDLPKGGVTIKVIKGDGNEVYRTHPSIDYMSKFSAELRLLEDKFGFTPSADSDLTRVESFNAAQGRLPLSGSAAGQGRSEPAADVDGIDPADLMSATDSVPPGTRIQ